MVQTYNELRVVLNNSGEVIEKTPTKRGTVRISEYTASVNNEFTKSTKLLYELAEVKPSREALLLEAEGLGLEYPKNIKTDKLIELIKEAKE